MDIGKLLISWYEKNKRDLPWRKTTNPYHIWISEIILQQTRVYQGLEYYKNFLERFPSVHDLAEANIEDVLKIWQGLGYYTRARNLHYTAKIIVEQYKGIFPGNYQKILRLKGIGPYTAAAIASFAFGESVNLIDGNVKRVISRLFGIKTDLDSGRGKLFIQKKLDTIFTPESPDLFNQAIMEFGALQCLPRNPHCKNCPLRDYCVANKKNLVESLPKKKKRISLRIRHFNYLVLSDKFRVIIKKRDEKDIWHSLFEFPLIEHSRLFKKKEILQQKTFNHFFLSHEILFQYEPLILNHQLTHQKLIVAFHQFEIKNIEKIMPHFSKNYLMIEIKDLDNYAFPRPIENYIKKSGFG